jgi:hypothetical protein
MHSLCCISPVPFERSQSFSATKHNNNKMFPESNGAHQRSYKERPNYYHTTQQQHQSAAESGTDGTLAASLPPLATKDLVLLPPPEVSLETQKSAPVLKGEFGKVFTLTTPEAVRKAGAANFSGELFQVMESSKIPAPHGGAGGMSNVAGLLYKWVNYGKGWRPRWFTLQDGVLSYYKVHGPDKVTVNQERHKGFRFIGEEGQRLMRKHKYVQSDYKSPGKICGEIHLKVKALANLALCLLQ